MTRRPGSAVALLISQLLLAACSEHVAQIPARGVIAGQPVATTVDDPLGQYYLERDEPGQARDPELDRRLEAAFARLPDGVPTGAELAWLSQASPPTWPRCT